MNKEKEILKKIEKSVKGGEKLIFTSTSGECIVNGSDEIILGLLTATIKAFSEKSKYSKKFIKEIIELAFYSDKEFEEELKKAKKNCRYSEKELEEMIKKL